MDSQTPEKPTHGRKEGEQIKFTGTVKEAILDVFQELGGKEGLLNWVKESATNKRVFYSAFLKMLPREVHVQNGDSPDALPFKISVEDGEPNDGNS